MMGNVSGIWGILTIVLTALVVSIAWWSQWPDLKANRQDHSMFMNVQQVERGATLLVMTETLLESMNDQINRLYPLVETNDTVDTAVANLIWARDYVIARMIEVGEEIPIDITNPYPKPQAAPLNPRREKD